MEVGITSPVTNLTIKQQTFNESIKQTFVTKAFPLNVFNAKVMIDINTAIENLKKLSEYYKKIEFTSSVGFYTNVCNALLLPEREGVSRYDDFEIKYVDGYRNVFSIRISNHHANTNSYIEHENIKDYNLSILISRRIKSNNFVASPEVRLDEFVYFDNRLVKIDYPLSKICDSIICFLQTGVYKDLTSVAFVNLSPKS